VATGSVVCHLCGRAITGGPWDFDHQRGGGGLHPAHRGCNRSEGAGWKKKQRLASGGGRR
jgi:hypothetical protein